MKILTFSIQFSEDLDLFFSIQFHEDLDLLFSIQLLVGKFVNLTITGKQKTKKEVRGRREQN